MRQFLLGLALLAAPAQAADNCPRSKESTGFADFALQKYFDCARAHAARLEVAGEDARTVAIAAESRCSAELSVAADTFNDCYGRDAGNRLIPDMRERAITAGVSAVIDIRAGANRR